MSYLWKLFMSTSHVFYVLYNTIRNSPLDNRKTLSCLKLYFREADRTIKYKQIICKYLEHMLILKRTFSPEKTVIESLNCLLVIPVSTLLVSYCTLFQVWRFCENCIPENYPPKEKKILLGMMPPRLKATFCRHPQIAVIRLLQGLDINSSRAAGSRFRSDFSLRFTLLSSQEWIETRPYACCDRKLIKLLNGMLLRIKLTTIYAV